MGMAMGMPSPVFSRSLTQEPLTSKMSIDRLDKIDTRRRPRIGHKCSAWRHLLLILTKKQPEHHRRTTDSHVMNSRLDIAMLYFHRLRNARLNKPIPLGRVLWIVQYHPKTLDLNLSFNKELIVARPIIRKYTYRHRFVTDFTHMLHGANEIHRLNFRTKSSHKAVADSEND